MYLDTSALVKLYVREPDSERVAALVKGRSLCASRLATVELLSALLRKEQQGEITVRTRKEAWMLWHFKVSLGYIHLEPLTRTVLSTAWELLVRCHPDVPLRTLDAIQLATFAQLDAGPLLTFDEKMRTAARKLGYELIAPTSA